MSNRRGLVDRTLGLIPWLWSNNISLLGTTLATVAGNVMLIVSAMDLATAGSNRYAAMLGYLLMPPVLVLGLLLIAAGAWRQQGSERAPGVLVKAAAMVLGDRKQRRHLLFVIGASALNLTLISVATLQGLHYVDSPAFCGKLCHTVMEPEYQAYKRSPHARVPCVDCHIGEGASWFVRSKLSGLRQVLATATGDFSRPVPTPIQHLRPARETCEKCHWTEKFHGTRLMVRHTFANDARNTRRTNVVRLDVGGRDKRTGRYQGIHWHVAPGVRIEYEALDPRRKTIGKVVMRSNGKTTTFAAPAHLRGKKVHERRTMDCVDCHNRPTHLYDPSPEVAVDRALSYGKLDVSLPYLRQQAVTLLRHRWDASSQASAQISRRLMSYYHKRHPRQALAREDAIKAAGKQLGQIYQRNIYPRLRITWNTYPSHIGHRQTTEGCFRCHDDEHKNIQRKDHRIRQDCDLCHQVLAEGEQKPDLPRRLLQLGSY